jgi:putative restriction endonuclease
MLLARAEAGLASRMSYEDIREPLTRLLREFGPSRRSYHPENPFWHLQSDGFWVVENADDIPKKKNNRSVSSIALLRSEAHGYVPDRLWKGLRLNESLSWRLSEKILSEFWPETVHGAIRLAAGLRLSTPDRATHRRAKRDPRFRDDVIRAYERRCAVCGYDGRLDDILLGLEAAHIQWHAFEGPDSVENGLALCSFHHIALDSGALGITKQGGIQISTDVTGNDAVDYLLFRFAGACLRKPQNAYPAPSPQYVKWHENQVFHGPPRTLDRALSKAAEDKGIYSV